MSGYVRSGSDRKGGHRHGGPGQALWVASVIVVCVALAQGFARPAAVVQPVAFNHRLHMEAGLECSSCHATVDTAARAGRPTLEACAICHTEPQGDGAEEKKVVEAVALGRDIPWQRLYRLASHVFFSHRRHVRVARLDCAACHGDMGSRERPPEHPPTSTSMATCLECHRRSGASLNCNACHR